MRVSPLDPGADEHFPQLCPSLAKSETNCNYIADGATLCASTHSKQWMKFVDCKYQNALMMPIPSANPFIHDATFDSALRECAQEMTDYSVDELRACTYGDEAEELRAANRDHVKTVFADLGMAPNLLWVTVNGKVVTDPATENYDSRVAWKAKLGTAICGEYSGTKPTACSSVVIA